MCGCQGYSSMSGNEYVGLVPSMPTVSSYEGEEKEGKAEGRSAQEIAQKASEGAEKAIGVLGTFKGLADTLTGKSGGSVSVNSDPEPKKDKKLYLYVAGGLLLLVAIIVVVKKRKKS